MRNSSSASRRAIILEFATIAFASVEAVVALGSGVWAGSVALVAFGADSIVEMLSAMVVLSTLRALVRGERIDPRSDHRAHRLIAVFFFVLAAYVVASAAFAMVRRVHPSENVPGFVICVASIVFMPALAWMKRQTSYDLWQIGSSTVARLLEADAMETALCGLLSLSTLVGIALTASLQWWWADPVASLAVMYFALREGREAWNCDPPPDVDVAAY